MGRVTKGSKINNGRRNKLHVVLSLFNLSVSFIFLPPFFTFLLSDIFSYCFVKKRNKFWSRRNAHFSVL